MNNTEFSTEFDVLYNNIMSNQAPGLDEYEKSVFLTKAQEDIIKSYFINIKNKTLKGFDDNEKRQIDFSSLTKIITLSKVELKDNPFNGKKGTAIYQLPNNLFAIINEKLVVERTIDKNKSAVTITIPVIPLDYLSYNLKMSTAYNYPPKNQAWRILYNTELDGTTTESTNVIEIISAPHDTLNDYTIRYIKKPSPIILVPLEGGLTIEGSSDQMECEVDPILHQDILQRAVELAKAAYTENLASQVALSNVSQTDLGIRNISNNE